MKCPNCGVDLSKNVKFCPNCGNSLDFSKQIKSTTIDKTQNNNTFDVTGILNLFSQNPKLILLSIVVIIAIFAICSIFISGDGTNANGGYDTTVYGVNFHVPEGYVESDRSDLTSGETITLEGDGSTIEISVRANEHFKESKYIDSKFSKTINNKEGTVYTYKPATNMAFVYYDQENLVVIRGASLAELEEIII